MYIQLYNHGVCMYAYVCTHTYACNIQLQKPFPLQRDVNSSWKLLLRNIISWGMYIYIKFVTRQPLLRWGAGVWTSEQTPNSMLTISFIIYICTYFWISNCIEAVSLTRRGGMSDNIAAATQGRGMIQSPVFLNLAAGRTGPDFHSRKKRI